MSVPDELRDYVDLSIDILKAQDPEAIQALKQFLTVLPDTTWIGNILSIAIDQLAEDAPDACRWLLRHPEYLQPEFDLPQKIQHDLLETLQNMGFIAGRDFQIEQRLQLSEELKTELHMLENPQPVSPLIALVLEDILLR